jgi:hypothetical protein
MGKHTNPRGLKVGGMTYKLALMAIGESMLIDVPDRKAFNRIRDRVKLSLAVPTMAGKQYHCTLYECNDLFKPCIPILIMRVYRMIDKPKELA